MINRPDFENAYGWNPANSNYKDGNKSIGTIYLTGAGFYKRPFTGIGIDSQFGWEEMVWYKQPTRTRDFSFKNIDDIDVGLVARCEINIKYLNYQDYIDLRKIIARERRFKVDFFNVDTGEWISRDMYCSENSRSKLFTLKQSLIGVVDCVIKFVGTNLDSNIVTDSDGTIKAEGNTTITYNLNGGSVVSGTSAPSTEKVTQSTQVELASANNLVPPSGYSSFDYWANMNGSTIVGKYGATQSITVWEDLNLVAQWKK